MTRLLWPSERDRLTAIVIDVGLGDARDALLMDIDRAYVARMKTSPVPLVQHQLDLDDLARARPPTEPAEHPLVQWIERLAQMCAFREEAASVLEIGANVTARLTGSTSLERWLLVMEHRFGRVRARRLADWPDRPTAELQMPGGIKPIRLVVVGRAGTGKTDWAWTDRVGRMLDAPEVVHLVVSAPEWLGSRHDPFSFAEFDLATSTGAARAQGLAAALRARAEKGQATLIVDDVDTVERTAATRLLEKLTLLASTLPEMGLIVLCRPSAVPVLPGFARAVLPESPRRHHRDIERSLAGRPGRSGRHQPTSPELGQRLLGELAAALVDHGDGPWGVADLATTVCATPSWDIGRQVWRSPEAYLDAFVRPGGLLGPTDPAGTEWSFLHPGTRSRLAGTTLSARRTIELVDAMAAGDPGAIRWAPAVGEAWRTGARTSAEVRHLAAQHPRRLVAVLPQLGPTLGPRATLELLWSIEHKAGRVWDGEVLRTLLGQWPDGAAVLADRLPGEADLDRVAFACFALFASGWSPGRDRPIGPWSAWGVPPDAPLAPLVDIPGMPLRLGRTAVTVGQYRRFDPQHAPGSGDDLPVTGVSWWRAWLYTAWCGGRLPTEAEWQGACLAGRETRFWSGDDVDDLDRVGWYAANCEAPQRVGLKPANPFGLHDMHGGVTEWCADRYIVGRAGGSGPPLRAVRGGSRADRAPACSARARDGWMPWVTSELIGFRVAMDAECDRRPAESEEKDEGVS